ncbi:MAG: hypothetical protein J5865_07405 [Lachnospiraceae bacterium]|nr:hypothetical protein [Lachnospiraceae bacterium]
MEKEYPASLFWTNLIITFLANHIYLTLPGLVLVVVGVWVRPCLYIGLGLLLLSSGLSLNTALTNRRVFLDSEDPNFQEVREAVLSENWRENVIELVEGGNGREKPENDAIKIDQEHDQSQ